MRFIIREQEYERLLAAGRLRYLSAGIETGVFETYRLTQAVDGFTVARIDLDRRDTAAANSTLLHLLLNPGGRPERLKLRRFSPAGSVEADVLVEDESFSVRRTGLADMAQEEMKRPPGYGLLMPAAVGLAFFIHGNPGQRSAAAIGLDEQRLYAPFSTSVEIDPLDEEEMTVTGQLVPVRPYLIRQRGTICKIWLDDYGLPVRLDDEDGTHAVEDRYVRQRR
ncbi:MAG TPA: hypothetical protein VLE70_18970 [Anaerolineae bacterium]|jgi:hypothetical protein|nr:hypothetical protein [Anaerolineae bacterium]